MAGLEWDYNGDAAGEDVEDALAGPGGIYYEGWLFKKSPSGMLGIHPWQKRYFEASDAYLTYYSKATKEEPINCIKWEWVEEVVWHQHKKNGCRFDVIVTYPAPDDLQGVDDEDKYSDDQVSAAGDGILPPRNLVHRVYALRGPSADKTIEWVGVLQEIVSKVQRELQLQMEAEDVLEHDDFRSDLDPTESRLTPQSQTSVSPDKAGHARNESRASAMSQHPHVQHALNVRQAQAQAHAYAQAQASADLSPHSAHKTAIQISPFSPDSTPVHHNTANHRRDARGGGTTLTPISDDRESGPLRFSFDDEDVKLSPPVDGRDGDDALSDVGGKGLPSAHSPGSDRASSASGGHRSRGKATHGRRMSRTPSPARSAGSRGRGYAAGATRTKRAVRSHVRRVSALPGISKPSPSHAVMLPGMSGGSTGRAGSSNGHARSISTFDGSSLPLRGTDFALVTPFRESLFHWKRRRRSLPAAAIVLDRIVSSSAQEIVLDNADGSRHASKYVSIEETLRDFPHDADILRFILTHIYDLDHLDTLQMDSANASHSHKATSPTKSAVTASPSPSPAPVETLQLNPPVVSASGRLHTTSAETTPQDSPTSHNHSGVSFTVNPTYDVTSGGALAVNPLHPQAGQQKPLSRSGMLILEQMKDFDSIDRSLAVLFHKSTEGESKEPKRAEKKTTHNHTSVNLRVSGGHDKGMNRLSPVRGHTRNISHASSGSDASSVSGASGASPASGQGNKGHARTHQQTARRLLHRRLAEAKCLALRVVFLLYHRKHRLTRNHLTLKSEADDLADEEFRRFCVVHIGGKKLRLEMLNAIIDILTTPPYKLGKEHTRTVGYLSTPVANPGVWPTLFDILPESKHPIRFHALETILSLLYRNSDNCESLTRPRRLLLRGRLSPLPPVAEKLQGSRTWQGRLFTLLSDLTPSSVQQHKSHRPIHDNLQRVVMGFFLDAHTHRFWASATFPTEIQSTLDQLTCDLSLGVHSGLSTYTQGIARLLLKTLLTKLGSRTYTREFPRNEPEHKSWHNLTAVLDLTRRFVLHTPWWRTVSHVAHSHKRDSRKSSSQQSKEAAKPVEPPLNRTQSERTDGKFASRPLAPREPERKDTPIPVISREASQPQHTPHPRNVTDYSTAELGEIACLMMRDTNLVKDRTLFLRRIPQCFKGSDATTWLHRQRLANSRAGAVVLGNRLMVCNFVHHVERKSPFKDDSSLFQFMPGLEAYLGAKRDAKSNSLANLAADTPAKTSKPAAGHTTPPLRVHRAMSSKDDISIHTHSTQAPQDHCLAADGSRKAAVADTAKTGISEAAADVDSARIVPGTVRSPTFKFSMTVAGSKPNLNVAQKPSAATATAATATAPATTSADRTFVTPVKGNWTRTGYQNASSPSLRSLPSVDSIAEVPGDNTAVPAGGPRPALKTSASLASRMTTSTAVGDGRLHRSHTNTRYSSLNITVPVDPSRRTGGDCGTSLGVPAVSPDATPKTPNSPLSHHVRPKLSSARARPSGMRFDARQAATRPVVTANAIHTVDVDSDAEPDSDGTLDTQRIPLNQDDDDDMEDGAPGTPSTPDSVLSNATASSLDGVDEEDVLAQLSAFMQQHRFLGGGGMATPLTSPKAGVPADGRSHGHQSTGSAGLDQPTYTVTPPKSQAHTVGLTARGAAMESKGKVQRMGAASSQDDLSLIMGSSSTGEAKPQRSTKPHHTPHLSSIGNSPSEVPAMVVGAFLAGGQRTARSQRSKLPTASSSTNRKRSPSPSPSPNASMGSQTRNAMNQTLRRGLMRTRFKMQQVLEISDNHDAHAEDYGLHWQPLARDEHSIRARIQQRNKAVEWLKEFHGIDVTWPIEDQSTSASAPDPTTPKHVRHALECADKPVLEAVLALLQNLGLHKVVESEMFDKDEQEKAFFYRFEATYVFWRDLLMLLTLLEWSGLRRGRTKVVLMKFCISEPAERRGVFNFVLQECQQAAPSKAAQGDNNASSASLLSFKRK